MIDSSSILLNLEHQQIQHNWLLIWMLGLVLLFLFARLFYWHYWKRFRLAVMYPVEASKLLKERNINLLQASVSMNIAASLSIALFLFLLVNFLLSWEWPVLKLRDLFLFSGLVLLVLYLRYASMLMLGRVFDMKKMIAELNNYWLINLKSSGIYLLLCSIVLNFIPRELAVVPVVLGCIIIVIVFMLNALRSVEVLRQYRVSLFYGILYLCTLEILPIVMIVGLVLS